MDPFIHGAAGAFIGWGWPRRWAGAHAAPIAVVGALLPDVDSFADIFVDPRSGFAHRGFTHSLLGIALLAPLTALVVRCVSKEKQFARLVALIVAGMLSHLLFDLPTPMGTMLFFPSHRFVHLDFLGYVDWTLFVVALFVLLAAWTYANRGHAVRRGIAAAVLLSALSWWLYSEWPTLALSFAATTEEATEKPLRTVYPLVLGGILLVLFFGFARRGWGFRQSRTGFGRIGVAALSVYLGLCVTAQAIALNRTQHFTREHQILESRHLAGRMGFCSLVGPLCWTGLVLAPEGVYQAQILPFSAGQPTFTLFPTTSDNPFVTRTRSIPEVRRFQSLARFPVRRYRTERGQHIIEYQEFGLSWRPLLRVVMNERQEVLTVGWVQH